MSLCTGTRISVLKLTKESSPAGERDTARVVTAGGRDVGAQGAPAVMRYAGDDGLVVVCARDEGEGAQHTRRLGVGTFELNAKAIDVVHVRHNARTVCMNMTRTSAECAPCATPWSRVPTV